MPPRSFSDSRSFPRPRFSFEKTKFENVAHDLFRARVSRVRSIPKTISSTFFRLATTQALCTMYVHSRDSKKKKKKKYQETSGQTRVPITDLLSLFFLDWKISVPFSFVKRAFTARDYIEARACSPRHLQFSHPFSSISIDFL